MVFSTAHFTLMLSCGWFIGKYQLSNRDFCSGQEVWNQNQTYVAVVNIIVKFLISSRNCCPVKSAMDHEKIRSHLSIL